VLTSALCFVGFVVVKIIKEKFATDLPQAAAGQIGEWRISAGFGGPVRCGKKRPRRAALSVSLC
jgi:hypothetical protein